jgi:hypothetical protein
MATKPLTLKGIVDTEASDHSEEVRELRRDNQRLDEALRNVRNELGQAIAEKENLERSIRALRNQLGPLHHALRAVFGEIELAVGEEDLPLHNSSPAPSAQPATNDLRWQSYKQQFPGAASQIIDALLAHDQMTYGQLKALLRRDYNTIKTAAGKLREAGAIVKEGTLCRLNR